MEFPPIRGIKTLNIPVFFSCGLGKRTVLIFGVCRGSKTGVLGTSDCAICVNVHMYTTYMLDVNILIGGRGFLYELKRERVVGKVQYISTIKLDTSIYSDIEYYIHNSLCGHNDPKYTLTNREQLNKCNNNKQ